MPVFDATALILFLQPNPRTPYSQNKQRIELLVQKLENANETIIVPTPALAELLISSGNDGAKYLRILSNSKPFIIKPFDQKAAIKNAQITKSIHNKLNFKHGEAITAAQLKFDRQILAIALAENQNTIYSDDGGIKNMEQYFNIQVIQTHSLPYQQPKI